MYKADHLLEKIIKMCFRNLMKTKLKNVEWGVKGCKFDYPFLIMLCKHRSLRSSCLKPPYEIDLTCNHAKTP